MLSYVTPQRFREMPLGVDIASLDDAELMSLLSQGTTVVNAYCNVPRIPQAHDFRGGTITGEEHAWRYPTTPFEVGQRRFYPWHWPIVSVEQFRIYVTNTQYVEIAPTELLINNSERYLEVVSLALTSSGLFNALIVPNVGLATPVARVNYTYGWDYTVVDEELTCSDGQTWRAVNQFWFDDAERAPIIKKNGAVETTGYTVDYVEGTVVFDDNLTATDRVSASYHHRLPPEIQGGTGYVAAHLYGEAEIHARGMAHLSRLTVAEVTMERRPNMYRGAQTAGLIEEFDQLVPEAALLLSGFRADHITVR